MVQLADIYRFSTLQAIFNSNESVYPRRVRIALCAMKNRKVAAVTSNDKNVIHIQFKTNLRSPARTQNRTGGKRQIICEFDSLQLSLLNKQTVST